MNEDLEARVSRLRAQRQERSSLPVHDLEGQRAEPKSYAAEVERRLAAALQEAEGRIATAAAMACQASEGAAQAVLEVEALGCRSRREELRIRRLAALSVFMFLAAIVVAAALVLLAHRIGEGWKEAARHEVESIQAKNAVEVGVVRRDGETVLISTES